VALVSVLCGWSVLGQAAEEAPGCAPVARIVSIQGTLQLQRAGQSGASYVRKLGAFMCQNDLLHTDAGSRAALFISPETLVRLDQNSTVRISQTEYETVVEFIQGTGPISQVLLAPDQCGAGYFITRYPKRFRVITPFTHAVVEGTEFLVAMRCEATEIAVFEGRVRAEQTLAANQAISLTSGQSVRVGKDQPPAIKVLVKPADAVQWVLYYPPLREAGPDQNADQKCEPGSEAQQSDCLTARAEQRLRAGRVEEAQRDIDEALKLAHDNANADALSSVISVVKNDKARALELAQRAAQLEPLNPRAWIALSYAQQAGFKLEDALGSAERSAELAPRSSTAQARVAELLMSLGRTRSAERAAQAAVEADPNQSRAHTVLGFVHLAQINTKQARADFDAAIERDSSDPLPRLGLGLAIIRDGKLKEGREEIEIAVALDPTNSLIRSYVGKAYYEENTKERDKLAAIQFGLAKQLDPKDPTPWFYDAILKQTQNRPVEALDDLQKSIELNDNRAAYRSRLLIDTDRATRSADLARIYRDLSFDRLAVTEAAKSLSSDPGSYSAHRFLADAYEQVPRSEIARDSEYLQSQLRQPLILTPISAFRAGTNPLSGILPSSGAFKGFGLTRPGSNDFTPLFEQRGLGLFLDGLTGSEGTNFGHVAATGVNNNIALHVAAGHFETDGFEANRDFLQDAYGAFVQVHASPELSFQAEYGEVHTQRGDSFFAFDPLQAVPLRFKDTARLARLGARYEVNPGSDFVLSTINQSFTSDFVNLLDNSQNRFVGDATSAEVQYTASVASWVGLIAGFGDTIGERFVVGGGPAPHTTYEDVYIYTDLHDNANRLHLTLGVSGDSFEQGEQQLHVTCPKVGLLLSPAPGSTVRAAAFRTVKRPFIASQTIEPTQVAGFNQFFDDIDATVSWRYGLGLDQRLPFGATVGVEATARDLDVPSFVPDVTWHEREERAYLYLPIASRRDAGSERAVSWAFTAEYQNERLRRDEANTGFEGYTRLDTRYVPLTITAFFGPLSARLRTTHVSQEGLLTAGIGADSFPVNSNFWITDLALDYRLPNRHGALSIGASNIFDREFQYVDPVAATPRFAKGRLLFVRLRLQL
jgi:tetratricopeptide (TPR) repeat protein